MTTLAGRATLVALGCVATAALAGFDRVLGGGAWFPPAAAAAWLAIGIHAALGALGLRRAVSFAGTLTIGAWFLLLVIFPETTWYGFPSAGAVATAVSVGAGAWARSQEAVAPVAPDPGYLTLLLSAAWAAGTAGAALLRSRASLAAPLPWLGLFGYAAGVGEGPGRPLLMVLFLTTLVAFLLMEGWARTAALPPAALPSGEAAAVGPPQARRAVRLGAVSVAGALVLPTLLPWHDARPIVSWAQIGPTRRTAISPIVEIRPRLTGHPTQVLFRVTASQPAYWRLTALDRFDGNTWQGSGDYRRARGTLRPESPAGGPTVTIRQRYAIASLGGIWLPVAYAPSRLAGMEASHDPASGTLVVDGLGTGDTYEAVSQAPAPTADELRSATAGHDVPARYLRLPPGTAAVAEIAEQVAASAQTPFDKAVALQSFLQRFTYDESVPPGHSDDYLLTFLTVTRAGYCEQFAGAMAVMLRTLGIPSRVAVGFLPGNARGSTYTVTTDEAHAWPEAYFDRVGWVAFEPTPRLEAVRPAYSLPAPQAPPNPATPSPSPAGTTPSLRPERATEDLEDPAPQADGALPQADAARRATRRILAGLAALLSAILAARELRIRLPAVLARSSGARPHARVAAAFGEFVIRAGDAVRPRAPWETESEYAGAIARALDLDRADLAPLVVAYQRARYCPAGVGEREARAAAGRMRRLRRELWRQAGWWGRARMLFSPRPLLPVPASGRPAAPAAR